jgi:hypothetical protein
VTVALQGDYGKPRPALIIQADQFADFGSVVILPLTSTILDAPNARPAAGQDRDNWVEGVKLGGNRAPARGRNRISRPEPTPLAAALAGFLGPARMAGGTQHSNVVRGGVSGLCPSTPASVIGQTKARPLAGVSPSATSIWGLIVGAAARLATLGLVRPLSCRYADAAGQAGMPMAVKVKAGAQAPA